VMVPVTVHPTGTTAPGNVVVTCPSVSLPPGVTCSPLTINANSASSDTIANLPIVLVGPSSTLTASVLPQRNGLPETLTASLPRAASKGLMMVGAGTGFAALFLLFLPGRKRLRAALGLSLVCLISLALGCGGGGGGGGGGTTNPVPTITSIAPPSGAAGGPAFTLTVNGTNFVNGATVSFGGAVKTTTFVNSTQLTAAITASDIAATGTPAVIVTNPGPGGGPSNSVNFTVNAAAVATTTTLTLTPPAKVASGPTDTFVFSVNVTGGSTPTGNLQLFDGGATLGAPSTLSNGTIMITQNNLIPVGTHAISAHYLGDSGHLGSSSGAINCTVTGNTTVTIAAAGATNGNQTLNVTIN